MKKERTRVEFESCRCCGGRSVLNMDRMCISCVAGWPQPNHVHHGINHRFQKRPPFTVDALREGGLPLVLSTGSGPSLEDSNIKVCEQLQQWAQTPQAKKLKAESGKGVTREQTSRRKDKVRARTEIDELSAACREISNNRCSYCLEELGDSIQLDTITPVHYEHGDGLYYKSKFYEVMYNLRNLAAVCAYCNWSKGISEGSGSHVLESIVKGEYSFEFTPKGRNRMPEPWRERVWDWAWPEDVEKGRGNQTPSSYETVAGLIQKKMLLLALRVLRVCPHPTTTLGAFYRGAERTLLMYCAECRADLYQADFWIVAKRKPVVRMRDLVRIARGLRWFPPGHEFAPPATLEQAALKW